RKWDLIAQLVVRQRARQAHRRGRLDGRRTRQRRHGGIELTGPDVHAETDPLQLTRSGHPVDLVLAQPGRTRRFDRQYRHLAPSSPYTGRLDLTTVSNKPR